MRCLVEVVPLVLAAVGVVGAVLSVLNGGLLECDAGGLVERGREVQGVIAQQQTTGV